MEQLGSPFRLLAKGLDVSRMNAELGAHPELWDAHKERRVAPGSPHGGMRDIWVRYNDRRPFERVGNFTAINDRHVPIWYDAAKLLPSVKEFALDITQKTRAEMLCGVLISKIPPGAGIDRHVDRGWHAENTSKLYLALRSAPGAVFATDTGSIEPDAGDLFHFNNQAPHWVHNGSNEDRVMLIVCVRTEMFGELHDHTM
jgi:hypothetical protein